MARLLYALRVRNLIILLILSHARYTTMKDLSLKNPLNTLYVGIDVDSLNNVVSIINFNQDQLSQFKVKNNQEGVEKIKNKVIEVLKNNPNHIFVEFVLESTGIYSFHTATYLSSNEELLAYCSIVYCINPKISAAYRKTLIDESKNDYIDSVLLANLARGNHLKKVHPWRGVQLVSLQRLTRHRKHIADLIVAEKNYLISNIFLKFSGLLTSTGDEKPFSNIFGTTSSFFITDFLTLDEIINLDIDTLIQYLQEKGNKHFSNPKVVAEKLRNAAKNSYQLNKISAEPITLAISSSFNVLQAYKEEIKAIDKGILKTIKGVNEQAYNSLISIPGIGPVFASGIIAEIGSIDQFKDEASLAKYAGLFWKENESGKFSADDTHLTKAGNPYLRYYLIEAAFSVKNHVHTYNEYYVKKMNEVKIHKEGRAKVLTARKLVKLIFALMTSGQNFKE